MKESLNTYNVIRNYFKQVLQDGSLPCRISFKEDLDNKALHLSLEDDGVIADYYYCLNGFAIHRFINKTGEVLISKVPENFIKIINRNINEVINKTEVI